MRECGGGTGCEGLGCEGLGTRSGANFIKFHQKNAPKLMKNARFGSSFLHVIHKSTPLDLSILD